jgi:hypothetical protein
MAVSVLVSVAFVVVAGLLTVPCSPPPLKVTPEVVDLGVVSPGEYVVAFQVTNPAVVARRVVGLGET